ncbi:MAG TPA: response regulator, partial [Anaeromyxobacter sp.]|nr:response regulator [Anaeromyxobacter sp.]
EVGMPTVLVVEDDTSIRDMMKRRLVLRGFSVLEAADGPEAILAVVRHNPDAILIDVGLPNGLSGWEVARAIRSDPVGATIRILAVTAHASPADAERARAAGCDGFFTKPVNFDALVAALRAPDSTGTTAP